MDLSSRKLIILGLGFRVTEPEFRGFFSSYGPIEEATIMVDNATGRSRGFGFVTFDNPEAAAKVLSDHQASPLSIKGKVIDPQRAVPKSELVGRSPAAGAVAGLGGGALPPSAAMPGVHTSGRVFIARLPPGLTQEHLSAYFSSFGTILDCFVPLHHTTRMPRGIAFLTFASADVADKVIATQVHVISGQSVIVDRAEPRKDDGGPSLGLGAASFLALQHNPFAAALALAAAAGGHGQFGASTLPPSAACTTNRIFVGRLPPAVTKEHVLEYFSQYGTVTDVFLPTHHGTSTGRGIAFVTFAQDGVVDMVMAQSHQVNGQPIAVDRAAPRKDLASPSSASSAGGSATTSAGGAHFGGAGAAASQSMVSPQYLIDPVTGAGGYYFAAPLAATSPGPVASGRALSRRAGFSPY